MSANASLTHAVTFVRNAALLLREKNVVGAWGGAEAQHPPPPRPATHRPRLGTEVAGETAVVRTAPGTRRGARFQKLRRAARRALAVLFQALAVLPSPRVHRAAAQPQDKDGWRQPRRAAARGKLTAP